MEPELKNFELRISRLPRAKSDSILDFELRISDFAIAKS